MLSQDSHYCLQSQTNVGYSLKIIHPTGHQAKTSDQPTVSGGPPKGSYAAFGNVNMNSSPPAMPKRTEMVPR